jgi:hypothetical protein
MRVNGALSRVFSHAEPLAQPPCNSRASARFDFPSARRILEIERRKFRELPEEWLTVLSLRGYVGADTKQPYRGALLTK